MNRYDIGFFIFTILFFASVCSGFQQEGRSICPVFFALMAFACALDGRAKRRKQ
jgi:hypothetical protein